MIFFETFWANSSGGIEGPETFSEKKFTSTSLHFLFHFPFHLLSSSLFHLLSSVSSCLFSCLAHSLFFFILSLLLSCSFSLLFHPVSSLLSIFSCLVLNLLLSCLVSPPSSSLVFLSCTVLPFIFSCSVPSSLVLSCLSFCLSLSPCDVVCCVVWCVSLWSWCCLVVVVLFGVCVCVCSGTLKKRGKTVCGFENVTVCTFKTSPCMPAPRAHVLKHVRLVPVHTGTFWIHTWRAGGHRQCCLPKFAHVWSSLGPRGPPKKPMDLTHFQFENRSRATRCRFLKSFAVPDEAVQFQQSWGHCGG